MSPLLDVRRQLPTLFRLRLGTQIETPKSRTGKRPAHLDGRLRVTSALRQVIAEIAERYDGTEPATWESPEGPEHETVIAGQHLRVILIPGQSLSQWWERWDGSGCLHRCDGVYDTAQAQDCSCPPDMALRLSDRRNWCVPVSRLTVVLPRLVERFGTAAAGRLDCHGIIGASGLGASVEAAQAMLDQGTMVEALVTIRRRGSGAKQYVWPELAILPRPVDMAALTGAVPPPDALPA